MASATARREIRSRDAACRHVFFVFVSLIVLDVVAMSAFGWGVAQDTLPLPLLVGYFVTGLDGAIICFFCIIALLVLLFCCGPNPAKQMN
jgi:hypothetical protein